jgi:hypothetical protein
MCWVQAIGGELVAPIELWWYSLGVDVLCVVSTNRGRVTVHDKYREIQDDLNFLYEAGSGRRVWCLREVLRKLVIYQTVAPQRACRGV